MGRGRFSVSSLSALPEPEERERTMLNKQQAEESVQPDKEDYLWHFTPTPEALLSILKNGVRATHSSCLSDKMDCLLRNEIRTIYVDLINTKKSKAGKPSYLEPEEETLRSVFEQDIFHPAFVSCFLQKLDDDFDAAWDQYTPTGGFGIGIKRDFVEDITRNSITGCRILGDVCKYTFEEQRKQVEATINDILSETTAVNTIEEAEELCRKHIAGIEKLTNKLLFVKRSTLSWEKEFRIAYVFNERLPSDKLKVENGKLFFFPPYRGEPKDWVGQIRISPYGNSKSNLRIARLFAQSFNIALDCVKVQPLPSLLNNATNQSKDETQR